MAVLNRDEFINKIHERLGDDVSDDAIHFLEDLTDTYNSLEERANGDGENWKKRYEDNDAAWKKRYQMRFFSNNGMSNRDEDSIEETPEDKALKKAETITINDLFGGKK